MTQSTIPTAQASKLYSDISEYFKSVAGQSEFRALGLAIATGTATFDTDALMAQPTDLGAAVSQYNAVITATPSWLAQLPPPQQTYLRSIYQAEASIINKDVSSGARPAAGGARAVAVMGGACAAVLGVAMVL